MQSSPSKSRFWFALPVGLVAIAMILAAYLTGDRESVAVADDGEVVARVGSIQITQQELEEDLAPELRKVERERHEILERGLEAAIEEALLEIEAAARALTRDELLDQIYAEVSEPSEADIDAFYEERKARIKKPKEEMTAQIRNYLRDQSRRNAHNFFVKELRERYEIHRYMEPLRTEVQVADSPAAGPADAPVTIVEFSDFQCPYCQRLTPTMDRIRSHYGDQVRLVFRQFPLPIHNNAQKAAEASLCADEEGKFWEMHDAMFADIRALGVPELKKKAGELKLDQASFEQCLDSGRYAPQVARDIEAGRTAGVSGTPAMFINGRFVSGAVPYDEIASVIDDELQRKGRASAQ